MERLTPERVEQILINQVTEISFRSPLSCGGKCCPIDEKAEKFLILVENAIQSKSEQKRTLIHEIAHVFFGVRWAEDGNVVSLVPDNVVEEQMVMFIREHSDFVERLFNRLTINTI